MKALAIFVAVLVGVGALTGFALLYAQRQATKLPDNSPAAFIESGAAAPGKTVVALAGDSLTHGAAGANYVDLLENKLPVEAGGYELINAGVNSELAYNVALRLDEIAACNPDFVIVLIGTNDANSRMSEENLARYMKEQKPPQVPDAAWYRENLELIASRLKSGTKATVAFLSLPTMGEDPEHPAYRLSGEYSLIVKEVAEEYGCAYLPLFETMDGYLRARPGKTEYDYSETRALMMKAVLKHYILRQSWNRIGARNGFILHTDFLHLNDTGADMLAGIVAEFLTGRSE